KIVATFSEKETRFASLNKTSSQPSLPKSSLFLSIQLKPKTRGTKGFLSTSEEEPRVKVEFWDRVVPVTAPSNCSKMIYSPLPPLVLTVRLAVVTLVERAGRVCWAATGLAAVNKKQRTRLGKINRFMEPPVRGVIRCSMVNNLKVWNRQCACQTKFNALIH